MPTKKSQSRKKSKQGKEKPLTDPNQDGGDRANYKSDIKVHGTIETHIPKDLLDQHIAERKEDAATHVAERIEDRRHENHKLLLEILGFLFVVIYAGLTGWMAISTAGQLKAARKATDAAEEQLKLSRQQFILSQRPWLSARFAPWGPLRIRPKGAMLEMTIDITNVGHSTAESVGYWASLIPDETETGHECDIPPEGDAYAGIQKNGLVIFPEHPFQVGTQAATTLDLMNKALEQRKPATTLAFTVIGCVAYKTSLDPSLWHLTKMVYRVDPVKPDDTFTPGTWDKPVKFNFRDYGMEAN
jgi:hypothetical protein